MNDCSPTLRWWARKERIRTLAEIPFQIDIHQVEKLHLYQEIEASVLHPKELGLNTSTIAHRLSVGYKTVERAVKWIEHSES